MPRAFLLDFLRDLAANNHKAWMDEHRTDYHRARATFRELTAEILRGVQQFEPDLLPLEANDALYRINKNDWSKQGEAAYKRHMSAGLKRDGRHARWAGYFLAVEPGHCWVGAGKWHPDPASRQRIRQEIHYSPAAFHALRQAPDFTRHFPAGIQGERLQRPPKGYAKTDPDIEWLKLKSFLVRHPVADADLLRPDFVPRALETLRAAQPLVRFLNEAISEIVSL